MTSPTQRTLKALRDDDWTCAITEHWNPFSHTRNDLFGFIDILAVRFEVILAIQCTSAANMSARVTKIEAEPKAIAWVEAGGRIQVWGWAKRGARGKRKTWTVRKLHMVYLPSAGAWNTLEVESVLHGIVREAKLKALAEVVRKA